ncbi:F-box domain containing protein [Pandoravirus quercus]|uniref:F-box domain containing protein n=1 Tax=Pandoravirus quercus TaxID=2107709 RepID=A0A2U7UAN2_9VIRU|nr:F-box domain containing protein [Pandoravirus quercus]AVK75508.1 F-box domain containing protein [Pandoravirus quercus]
MASADIFFGGLPAEILSDVAALLPVVDIVRLAMTCRVMHALATCQAMWRRLFVRDFAHLYSKGLPVQPWPHGDHPDDPWHEMAIELWRGTGAVSVMPPRCRPVEHLPAPFAHAFAAGKDWRWLYRAHLATSPEPPDESFSGPRSQRLDPSTLAVADWTSGSRVGYTAEIIFGGHSGDEVISWTEFMPAQAPDDCYWSVECTATSVTHRGAADASGIIPVFIFSRIGARYWLAVDKSKTGAFASLSPNGTRDHGRCRDGDIETIVSHYSDGSTVSRPLRNGRAHGECRTTYANGDTVCAHYVDGALTKEAEFVCSLACPRPEWAGRILSKCVWRTVPINVEGSPTCAIVPADDSDDARLFWRYVAEGLIGWCPRTRRVLLDTVGTTASGAGQRDAEKH